ncbi:MAG TPA: M90 family metallopeptidase [Gammaproteobacteria bacterium]
MFKHWRRRRLAARATIPDERWAAVTGRLPSVARLDAEQTRRLRELALLFLHEKRIEPAGGLELTEEMRLRIAVLACVPILELGLDAYEGFASVIVYPGEFLVRGREYEDEAGVVHVGDDVLVGESWEQGPVILGWEDVEASGRGDGFDVVAHEFAHKLDMLDGVADGLPPLHPGMRLADWTASFTAAYEDHCARVDRDEETWLDPYAAEDPAEFFAVCAEVFFDAPAGLRREYPDVYRQLAAFFKQDPAAAHAGRARDRQKR